MTRHDDRIRLGHMIQAAEEAHELAAACGELEFKSARVIQLSVRQLITDVGEAAARLSPATREISPEVPWTDIMGMRHRLVHGYDKVDLDILWDTAIVNLPELIGQLRHCLDNLKSSG